MTDRPILFSAPMVRALLAGTKTQTRRILKPQPPSECSIHYMLGNESWLPEDQRSPLRHHWESWGGPLFHGRPKGHMCGSFTVKMMAKPGDRLFPAMPIPSLNRNYCADTHGHIWSRARDGETWRKLAPGKTSKGYLSVTPAHDGRYRTRFVHDLVAETYYGDRPSKDSQIRHLNGDQDDCSPENLDYGTQEDNWTDRAAHGRGAGDSHHASILTTAQAAEIRESAKSQRALARQFGVAQSTIWAAKNNQTWREDIAPKPPNMPRWVSRLTLPVTEVRVERLQDISEEDALAEGVVPHPNGGFHVIGVDHPNRDFPYLARPTAREMYAALWDVINGSGAWEANPWVVAYSFTVERRNIDASEEG